MEVVFQYDAAEQLPAATDDRLFQAVDQPSSVRIIQDDLLSGIAPRHDMIDGVIKFDPESPWRAQTLRTFEPYCQAEKQKNKVCHREAIKSVTAKRSL
jgi:hypothetical protein